MKKQLFIVKKKHFILIVYERILFLVLQIVNKLKKNSKKTKIYQKKPAVLSL